MRYLIISFAIDLLECGLYGQKYSMRLGAIGEGEHKREDKARGESSCGRLTDGRPIGQQTVASGS